jgi:hypothetical protein
VSKDDDGIFFIGGGLHFSAFRNDSVNMFTNLVNSYFLASDLAEVDGSSGLSIFVMPVLPSWIPRLAPQKEKTMTAEKSSEMNAYLK